MPKKVKLKTSKNSLSVNDYIKDVDPSLQSDAKKLLRVFKEATGVKPKMWGEKRKEKQALLLVF